MTSPAPISVENLPVLNLSYSHNMLWKAKVGCVEHHHAAVERIVNAYPPAWPLRPQSGELFDNLDHCNRRLRGYSFAEGFDIVRKRGGSGETPQLAIS